MVMENEFHSQEKKGVKMWDIKRNLGKTKKKIAISQRMWLNQTNQIFIILVKIIFSKSIFKYYLFVVD